MTHVWMNKIYTGFYPHGNITIIKQIYSSKHPEAATMAFAKNMTPWYMHLVAKGMIIMYKEFDVIWNGNDQYNLKIHRYYSIRST